MQHRACTEQHGTWNMWAILRDSHVAEVRVVHRIEHVEHFHNLFYSQHATLHRPGRRSTWFRIRYTTVGVYCQACIARSRSAFLRRYSVGSTRHKSDAVAATAEYSLFGRVKRTHVRVRREHAMEGELAQHAQAHVPVVIRVGYSLDSDSMALQHTALQQSATVVICVRYPVDPCEVPSRSAVPRMVRAQTSVHMCPPLLRTQATRRQT